MPKFSELGNVRKICKCGRKRWIGCPHPWYLDYKAPKDHPKRPNARYRKNLDLLYAAHAETLGEAQEQGRRAIVAWLDGRAPDDLLTGDQPTLTQVLDRYVKRPDASPSDEPQIGRIKSAVIGDQPFGDWRMASITREALEEFRLSRPKIAANRNLALLRAMFNWATVAGLVSGSPFKVGDVSVVRLAREDQRTRRLQPGEEEKLLLGARSLRPLIVAALETGCRRGELLSLQWHQVRFSPRAELFLPAGKTKARKDRRIPISTALRAVLDERRLDSAGEPFPPDAYVFGDELGRKRDSHKTAWKLTCQRAKIAGLRFHDLRREAGSRWMDAGVPLGTIQRWLGHYNISQTSTYLAASLGNDSDDMRAFEERIGRLTQVDTKPNSNGHEPTSSGQEGSEQTRENAVVH